MLLYELLKEYGIPAKEARTRLENGQIEVNGEPQNGDYDLGNVIDILDQGFFLKLLYDAPGYNPEQIMLFGLDNLMGGESNIDNAMTNFLKDFKMIKIAKDKAVFVKTQEGDQVDEIGYDIESYAPFKRKYEAPYDKKQDNSAEIEKWKELVAKYKMQLEKIPEKAVKPREKVQNQLDNALRKLEELGVNESRNIKRFNEF